MSDAKNLIRLLLEDESPHRDKLVELWLDHTLAQPLGAWLDPTEIAEIILQSMSADNTRRFAEKYAMPAHWRARVKWNATPTTPGEFLSSEAEQKLEAWIRTEPFPNAKWARGAVDPKALRAVFAPIMQDVLLKFAKSITSMMPGKEKEEAPKASKMSSGFGLRSMLKKGVSEQASKLASAGKNVLGSVNLNMEDRIKGRVKEYSEQASTTMKDALKERLRTEEGRKLMADARAQILKRFLETTFAALAEDIDRLDPEVVWEILAMANEHNRTRAAFKTGLKSELEALLKVEAERTLGEVLEEMGLLEMVRGNVARHGNTFAKDFLAKPEVEAWLSDLLTAAQ